MKPFSLALTLATLISPGFVQAHLDPTPSSFNNIPRLGAGTFSAKVSITVEGPYRFITGNGIPNHSTGRFPGPGNPNAITEQRIAFRVPLSPVANPTPTPLRRQPMGVAVNGIPFEPGTAEFWNNDPKSGWTREAIVNGQRFLGLDQNNAHVQPNGSYHYHSIPEGLLERLNSGMSAPMKLIGYAADGFPIYSATAFSDPNSAKSPPREMKSSWQLKKGTRPSAPQGPGGSYDGTYVQDYEFVSGLGDLDESNGRAGVTPEYPGGTYYYVATATFPFLPRSLRGTPDPSFERNGPPGPPPGGPRRPPPKNDR